MNNAMKNLRRAMVSLAVLNGHNPSNEWEVVLSLSLDGSSWAAVVCKGVALVEVKRPSFELRQDLDEALLHLAATACSAVKSHLDKVQQDIADEFSKFK